MYSRPSLLLERKYSTSSLSRGIITNINTCITEYVYLTSTVHTPWQSPLPQSLSLLRGSRPIWIWINGPSATNASANLSSLNDRMEAETSGDVIDREVEANRNVPRRPPPAEVLHSIEHYFATSTDLSECFVLPSMDSGRHSNDDAVTM